MADENKLLGTLELSTGTVFATIEQVNGKLETLGKNVSLDLTNAVNAAVQSLNQAITNLNNAHPNTGGGQGNSGTGANNGGSSGNSNSQNAQLRETVGLMTDMANIQTKIANSNSPAAIQHMTATYNRLNGELTTNQQLLNHASQTRQVQNAQERATVAGLVRDERELLRIDRARQEEADRVQQEAISTKKQIIETETALKSLDPEKNAQQIQV